MLIVYYPAIVTWALRAGKRRGVMSEMEGQMAAKWEYLILDYGLNKARSVNGHEIPSWQRQSLSLADYINKLGEDGWEMTGSLTADDYTFGRLFFKRPKP